MPRPDQPPRAEFKQNAGTPDQLPQGEAQQLNEAIAAIPEPEEVGTPEEELPSDDVSPAGPADYEPIYTPETEDEDFLTGPSLRPDEAQFVGASPRQPLSPNIRRAIPVLQRAASEPGASKELRDLVAALLREA